MTDLTISRRTALLGGAAVPIVMAGALNGGKASAKADMKGVSTVLFSRSKLGAFEVTTLLDGARTVPDPQTIFGMNVSPEAFAEASGAHFLPTNKTRFFFTPTIVNTGNELVLFDTGLGVEGGGNIVGALASAGYTPDQVDIVVITHMHPDHIGGMMADGKPTFPNARYVTGSAEYNFWTTKGADNRVGKLVAANVKPVADKITFLDDGGTVASGITSMAAFGHTPGHMGYMLESDGQQLLLTADAANHHVWSLAYPDWEVKFDADKAAAAATRKTLFGMLAADKIPFIGYHMPFPAKGFVEANGDGFRYVPASYQLDM